MTVSAEVRFQAAPARFQADQEQRHLPGLEPPHRCGAVHGVTTQFDERNAGFGQRGFHQVQHRGELREQQNPPALGDHFGHHLQQIVQLAGRSVQSQPGQPGVAADLAQFQ